MVGRKSMLIRVDPVVHDAVRDMADGAGVPINRWIVEAITDRIRSDSPAARAHAALGAAGLAQFPAGLFSRRAPRSWTGKSIDTPLGKDRGSKIGAVDSSTNPDGPCVRVVDTSALYAAVAAAVPGHRLWKAAVFESGLPVVVPVAVVHELARLVASAKGPDVAGWLFSSCCEGGPLYPYAPDAARDAATGGSAAAVVVAGAVQLGAVTGWPAVVLTRDPDQAKTARKAKLLVAGDSDPLVGSR